MTRGVSPDTSRYEGVNVVTDGNVGAALRKRTRLLGVTPNMFNTGRYYFVIKTAR